MSNPIVDGGSITLERIDFWTRFKGVDPSSPGPMVGKDYARRAHNVKVDSNGILTTVESASTDGSLAAAGAGMTLFAVPRSSVPGSLDLIIGTTVGFQAKLFADPTFDTWAAITGAALTIGTTSERFSFMRWGAYVLAANPDASTLIQKIDIAADTYAAIAGSPAAFHITGFANRVVASRVTGNLGYVQWSVKNDSDDWSGLGSGFEDLLVAAGSRADRPWSVWPISETQAIVVCERSLMMMTATDNFDAPFRFTLISGAEGTPYPYTVAAVPGGIIYAGWTDIWYVTEGSITPLTKPFLNETLFGQDFSTTDHLSELGSDHSGVYVAQTNEYWIKTGTTGYRYHLANKCWTQQTMNAGQMAYIEGYKFLDPAGTAKEWAVYFPDLGNVVDVVRGSANASIPDLMTGDIELEQPEYRLDPVYVSLLYSTRDTTERVIEIQMSRDDGDWETYGLIRTKPYVASTVTTSPINRTHNATFHRSVTGNKIAFRIKPTASITMLKVLRLSVHCYKTGWTPTTP